MAIDYRRLCGHALQIWSAPQQQHSIFQHSQQNQCAKPAVKQELPGYHVRVTHWHTATLLNTAQKDQKRPKQWGTKKVNAMKIWVDGCDVYRMRPRDIG